MPLTASKRPFIVGLTGGIGSGKSTVADFLAAEGAEVVDTDALAHQLTGPGGQAMPALIAAFGPEIANPLGALDRQAMRQQVFADPAARQRLESILHPLIRAEADARCAASTAPYVVLAVPLLVETGSYIATCDRILVVDCPESTQIARVQARNGLGENEVRAILAAQASRAQRLAIAHDVVDNDSDLGHLKTQVKNLAPHYRQLAAQKAKASC